MQCLMSVSREINTGIWKCVKQFFMTSQTHLDLSNTDDAVAGYQI